MLSALTLRGSGKTEGTKEEYLGENDQYMGIEQGKQAHEARTGSKLVILPTGHAAAIVLPEKFNAAVLEFLS